MKSIKIILFGCLALLIGSCTDYLDPYPNGDRQEEDIWGYQDMVQGLVGQCYDNMPRNYNDNEGAYLEGATDNAVLTSNTNSMKRLANGSLVTSQDPFQTYWDRDYRSIRSVNMFLENRRGFNKRFLINKRLDSLVRYRLQGEAFALRAWFHWDLLQKFGGKGTDGQMLGIPIILEPIDLKGDLNFARNTYDECVKQILADCDSAYKYLPIAHRDFLAASSDLTYAGGRYWGRFDGITTKAIKAMVYLTWASPRFNPNNDISRWDSAAVNAKKVIDFKLTKDNVTNGFKVANQVEWFNPQFPGVVWDSRSAGSNADMETMFYPGGFRGNGVIGASQELVNAFPMKNGYPITDARSNYNPADPYKDRDPRFYTVIFHNNAVAKRNNTGAVMYTFENFEGGKDAAGAAINNSLTNYHIKKFVFMGWNRNDATVNTQPHAKFFFRWAHMCLAFAEAANHVVGPANTTKYGLSPMQAIQYLRTRKNYDGGSGLATDPYLTEVANAGEATFDAFVKNERRIETCFEGTWFYDIRRWTTTLDELNKPVHGAAIIKNGDGTFTYDLNKVVDTRNYTSAYLPIPYQEMLRMSKLVQNEGWDGWK